MFTITITAAVVTLVASLLVMIAVNIHKDNSELTQLFKKMLTYNTIGLLIVLASYSGCLYAYTKGFPEYERFFIVSLTIRDFSDFTLAPICILVVKYLCALTDHKKEVERAARKAIRYIRFLYCLIIITLGVFDVCTLTGVYTRDWAFFVYVPEMILLLIILIFVSTVVGAASRTLGKIKTRCFDLFIIAQTAALMALQLCEESFFFTVNAALLIFLYIAMQTDRANKSEISAQKAEIRADNLNSQLDSSQDDLRKERYILKDIASIYASLFIIDIDNNSIRELVSPEDGIKTYIEEMFGSDESMDLGKIIRLIVETDVKPKNHEVSFEFTDLSTLSERMKGRKSINLEVLSEEDEWYRFSFIRIGMDIEEELREVAFATENIDREKREMEQLVHTSLHDLLTGTYNRNAYIDLQKKYRETGVPEDLWVIITDINGLKVTNDTKGHKAGDEQIRATAECLDDSIGEKGDIYRNGGDEFVAVVHAEKDEFYEIIYTLDKLQKEWRGRYSNELMFSIGYVSHEDYPDKDFDELVHEADRRMYENKKQFYISNPEMDRRSEYYNQNKGLLS